MTQEMIWCSKHRTDGVGIHECEHGSWPQYVQKKESGDITQIMRDNRSMRERLEYLTYELAEVHRMHQLAKEEIQKLRSIIAAETERGQK